MADPIAVIIRFAGDPEDLLERFERARQLWIDAQDAEYQQPAFYAACKSDDGIVIVSAWESAAAHRAFGHGIEPHVEAVGMRRPDHIERIRIKRLGWD
ncbi:MAG: hypothetical protein ACRDPC_03810 [Solirubrobacteraceae bacterium]